MANKPNVDGRIKFSARLRECLEHEGYAFDSPTSLAKEFNARYGGRPITVHAARKWLIGEAIPTQEKICLLAQWLKVSAEWLRFGGTRANAASTKPVRGAAVKDEDAEVLNQLRQLNKAHQKLVLNLISVFADLEQRALLQGRNKKTATRKKA